jgi:hypothetical protein
MEIEKSKVRLWLLEAPRATLNRPICNCTESEEDWGFEIASVHAPELGDFKNPAHLALQI